jgi:uncharacterized protein involved in outer membrane biogenesis
MQTILAKNSFAPMDQNLVFAKTPIGDEAVRQSTRVVQRNLRMLLVQVDGKLSVAELGAKLGDPEMVERALRELEDGGYIAPALEAVSVWQESKLRIDRLKAAAASGASVLGSTPMKPDSRSTSNNFSSFGKPLLQAGDDRPASEEPGLEQRGLAPNRSHLILILSALSGLVLLAVSVVMFFPYTRFKADIEKEMASIWQTPVSVGDVRFNLLPQPLLLLSDVRIGRGGESVIDKVRILGPYYLLGSGRHSLPRVEIDGGKIAIAHLMALSASERQPGQSASTTNLESVAFDHLSIGTGGLVFGELVGEASFGNRGQIEKVSLQTVDRSLRIEAQPGPEGMTLDVEGVGWRPTDASALTLDSLQARALLTKDKLLVQGFDMHALGGVLRGSWLLDWSKGLVMAGEANLERLDSRKVTVHFAPALNLEGELLGLLRLQGRGTDWQSLWANLDATLEASVLRGALIGVDLGEAARRGPGAPVRAGTTKFDRLAVKMAIDPRQVVGRDLSINAGLFTATGDFVAKRDRQVDGNLTATMQTSVSLRTIPLKVSGTLPNLQAVSLR